MTKIPLWLNYKLVDRGDGKFSKPPVSPFTGEICSKTDEGMYTDFERALAGVEQHNLDGVGFVFQRGFIAIDLDDCFDEQGKLKTMAADIVDHFIATYMEYSPSGNGLHIFCQGTKPNNRTRSEGLEVYAGANFVTVTGDKVPDSGEKVLNMQHEIDWLFDTYLPELDTQLKSEIIFVDHGDKSPGEWLELGLTCDDKFNRLYSDTEHLDDESGHDFALLCKMAYWLNRDTVAMEKAFFDSPWVHSKDRRHISKIDKRQDYFDRTLAKAVASVSITAAANDRKIKNASATALRISETSNGEIILPLTDYTDVANARAFSATYETELTFTNEWGWCYFNGFNWELNRYDKAQQCAIMFAENLLYVAKEHWETVAEKCKAEGIDPNSSAGKAMMKGANEFMLHAKKTCAARGVTAMLTLAESMLVQPASLFDGNPWTLNTPGVGVDLRTGETFEPSYQYYDSMLTNIPYDPNCENNGMWDSFLHQIFCDNEELIDYMQFQLGAACVGKVYEENLLIACGGGSNGKSTLFNVLRAILGDYCVSVNPDILMDKAGYEQQIAMASIKGKRLVIGQETESGQKLSAASVKRMVSSDNVVGRVLNHGYIEFEPTHTVMLATNHLPSVKDNDEGTWRRLTVVPFDATIDRESMITNYRDILVAEDGAYILKWLVEGAMRFYAAGCTYGEKPPIVHHVTLKYRNMQKDIFEQFCDERLEFFNGVRAKTAWCMPADVYKAYLAWCEERNLKSFSLSAFSKKILGKGADTKRMRRNGKNITVWVGVKVKDGLDVIEG